MVSRDVSVIDVQAGESWDSDLIVGEACDSSPLVILLGICWDNAWEQPGVLCLCQLCPGTSVCSSAHGPPELWRHLRMPLSGHTPRLKQQLHRVAVLQEDVWDCSVIWFRTGQWEGEKMKQCLKVEQIQRKENSSTEGKRRQISSRDV